MCMLMRGWSPELGLLIDGWGCVRANREGTQMTPTQSMQNIERVRRQARPVERRHRRDDTPEASSWHARATSCGHGSGPDERKTPAALTTGGAGHAAAVRRRSIAAALNTAACCAATSLVLGPMEAGVVRGAAPAAHSAAAVAAMRRLPSCPRSPRLDCQPPPWTRAASRHDRCQTPLPPLRRRSRHGARVSPHDRTCWVRPGLGSHAPRGASMRPAAI